MKQKNLFVSLFLFFLASNSLFAQPTAVCADELIIDILPSSCSIELWAIDFDDASFSTNSQIIDRRVNRVFDLNNNNVIDPDELLDKPPVSNSVAFDFDDINKVHMVQFWVIDDNDQFDFCLTSIDFSDVQCPFELLSLNGKIESPDGIPIKDLNLSFERNSNNTKIDISTNNEGMYDLPHVALYSSDYKAMPMSNDAPLKGVDSEDLNAIVNHILNNNPFSTPYQFIAADVNNDGKISAIDIQILRKVIQNPSSGFPNGVSWRFVPKDYNFNFNPNSPSIPVDYPQFIWLNNVISHQFNVDFIGIKIGDVTP